MLKPSMYPVADSNLLKLIMLLEILILFMLLGDGSIA